MLGSFISLGLLLNTLSCASDFYRSCAPGYKCTTVSIPRYRTSWCNDSSVSNDSDSFSDPVSRPGHKRHRRHRHKRCHIPCILDNNHGSTKCCENARREFRFLIVICRDITISGDPRELFLTRDSPAITKIINDKIGCTYAGFDSLTAYFYHFDANLGLEPLSTHIPVLGTPTSTKIPELFDALAVRPDFDYEFACWFLYRFYKFLSLFRECQEPSNRNSRLELEVTYPKLDSTNPTENYEIYQLGSSTAIPNDDSEATRRKKVFDECFDLCNNGCPLINEERQVTESLNGILSTPSLNSILRIFTNTLLYYFIKERKPSSDKEKSYNVRDNYIDLMVESLRGIQKVLKRNRLVRHKYFSTGSAFVFIDIPAIQRTLPDEGEGENGNNEGEGENGNNEGEGEGETTPPDNGEGEGDNDGGLVRSDRAQAPSGANRSRRPTRAAVRPAAEPVTYNDVYSSYFVVVNDRDREHITRMMSLFAE